MPFYDPIQEEDEVSAKLFALRTGLVMLASCLADRLEPGELRARLAFCAEEADMRGGERRFLEAGDLLRTMAAHAESMPGTAYTSKQSSRREP